MIDYHDEVINTTKEQLRVMVAEKLGCSVLIVDEYPICGCDPDVDGWPHWDARYLDGRLYDWPGDIAAAWKLDFGTVRLHIDEYHDELWVFVYLADDSLSPEHFIREPWDDTKAETYATARCRAWLLANA